MKNFTSFKTPSILQKLSVFVFALILFPAIGFSQISSVQLNVADNGPDWVVPCGVTLITVSIVGGGGAGGDGGQNGGGNPNGGGGGGGGEFEQPFLNLPVIAGQTFTFNVGLGGIFGGIDNGGATTFSTATAAGGLVGGDMSGATPGVGGLGGTGNPGVDGSLGDDGVYLTSGGFGGNNGSGSGGATATIAIGDGVNGGIGGGGAGGFGNNTVGGDGGNGQIIINMTVSSYPGADQFLLPCATTATLIATPPILPLIGIWTNLLPGGAISSPLTPTTDITGMTPGTVYTVDYEISGAGCPTLIQTLTIVTNTSVADAGNDLQICSATFTGNANTPDVGFTGTWSCVGCGPPVSVTPTTSNDPNQIFSGFDSGESVVLTWTIDDGLGCVSSDQVTFNYPADCQDGPCGAVQILTGGAGCISGDVLDPTIATPSTGMTDPGCGVYNAGVTADIWYSVVVGASGFLNMSFLPPTTATIINLAFYNGPCDDLTMLSCQSTTGTLGSQTYVEAVFTPGETIYIRVWEQNNNLTDIDACIYEFNNTSEIEPGMNNIACGETFYDPGGTGNYYLNQNVVYYICPPNGSFASVDFSSWTIGNGDQITILDGAASNAPIIGTINQGTGTNQTYTSSGTYGDSCLTIIWMSNNFGPSVGWVGTANCSPIPGVNTIDCTPSDCLGGCMPTICAIPGTATFIGLATGASLELNESNNGCFQEGYEGEQCSNWFLVNPSSPGTFTLNIYVNPGQDHDFLVYEAFAPSLGCPSLTSNQPIRCNAVGSGNALGTGFNSASPYDVSPYYEPEIVITAADIAAGIYFIIYLKNYNPGCSNPEVELTFGGTASVSCEPPSILPVELISFMGDTEGRYNMLYWQTASEIDNDYFTLLGSSDGSNWQQLAIIDGAGTTQEKQNYEFEDDILSLEMTYYKLKQTDFDGNFKYSETIALARDFVFNTLFSSVYPNPSDDTFYFMYGGHDFNTTIIATIYNNLGQVVISQEFGIFSDDQANSINCEGLATGTYNIVLSQGDKHEIQKISLIQ